MSTMTPDMTLYVDNSGTPYYWIDVTLPSNSGFEIMNHGEVPEEDNPNDQIHIDVNLQSNNGGNETVQIDLGELPIDLEDGEIHIHLLDTALQPKGGGIVKTEEATESAKPIL